MSTHTLLSHHSRQYFFKDPSFTPPHTLCTHTTAQHLTPSTQSSTNHPIFYQPSKPLPTTQSFTNHLILYQLPIPLPTTQFSYLAHYPLSTTQSPTNKVLAVSVFVSSNDMYCNALHFFFQVRWNFFFTFWTSGMKLLLKNFFLCLCWLSSAALKCKCNYCLIQARFHIQVSLGGR